MSLSDAVRAAVAALAVLVVAGLWIGYPAWAWALLLAAVVGLVVLVSSRREREHQAQTGRPSFPDRPWRH